MSTHVESLHSTGLGGFGHDVDDFKQVNDLYGHQTGDDALLAQEHPGALPAAA